MRCSYAKHGAFRTRANVRGARRVDHRSNLAPALSGNGSALQGAINRADGHPGARDGTLRSGRCGRHTPTACHGHSGQAYCTGLCLSILCCNGIFRRTGYNGALAIRNEMELARWFGLPGLEQTILIGDPSSQGPIRSVSSFPPDLRSPRKSTLICARSRSFPAPC